MTDGFHEDSEERIEDVVLRTLDPGRYRNVAVIGSGGMGIVYRAEDAEMRRPVALKTLRTEAMRDHRSPLDVTPPRPGTPESGPYGRLAARLLHEARITGALEHPGVVPVHEVGRTPAGVPYYTMRLLRGERTLLDALLGETEIEARLPLIEVFLKVCDTMAFAHSRGVIHRDLKPANIGLGEFGEVVVLDWGVAKVAGTEDVAADLWRDRLETIETAARPVGTPGYMSPEAATGDPTGLDERSDVYSLGVILFSILTGRMPFPAGTLRSMIEKLLTEAAPEARTVEPDVPDGLSRICARALSRRPEDRFSGPGELAKSIRRWQHANRAEREVLALAGEAEAAIRGAEELPADARLKQVERATALLGRAAERAPGHVDVEAVLDRCREIRDGAIGERERAARRRALRVVGVVVLIASAVAATAVSAVLDGRRREAERARAEAEDLAGFMLFDLHDRLQGVGRLDILADVARHAMRYYADRADADTPAASRRRGVVALAHVAEVLRLEGNLGEATAALESALAIARGLRDEDPTAPLPRHDLALTALKLGRLRLRAGASAAAEAEFGEARDLLVALSEDYPDVPKYAEDLATTRNRIGELLERRGDGAGANAEYDDALKIRRGLAEREDADADARLDFARSLERRGRIRLDAGERDGARADLEASLAVRRRVVRESPLDALPVREVATSLLALVDALVDAGEPEEALAPCREAVGIQRRLAGADPENTSASRDLSVGLGRLSGALRATGDLRTALGPCREARAIRESLVARDPGNAKWQEDLASSEYREGRLHQLLGGTEEARDLFAAAADRRRRRLERDDANAVWHRELAWTLLRASEVEEAAGALAKARELMDEATAAHARATELDRDLVEDHARFEARRDELHER